MIADMLPSELPAEEGGISADKIINDLTEARELYDNVLDSSDLSQICSSEALQNIKRKLEENKGKLTTRNSVLWLQYLDMVDVLKMILKAEHTGDLKLHLQSVHKMLPYFAASGHTIYPKSAYVYLQSMHKLPETNPEVHHKFEEEYHVVRRSNRYWAGLWTDLII